ncbi:hypothetical protein B0H10DRAFT_1369779 [Mycena sp. CBHHK59/15]|nr:hypothetical protein B0H10DRAFT_1369779 [Mycena sp. CBHHK59/15]
MLRRARTRRMRSAPWRRRPSSSSSAPSSRSARGVRYRGAGESGGGRGHPGASHARGDVLLLFGPVPSSRSSPSLFPLDTSALNDFFFRAPRDIILSAACAYNSIFLDRRWVVRLQSLGAVAIGVGPATGQFGDAIRRDHFDADAQSIHYLALALENRYCWRPKTGTTNGYDCLRFPLTLPAPALPPVLAYTDSSVVLLYYLPLFILIPLHAS